jgi:hypothetical protein
MMPSQILVDRFLRGEISQQYNLTAHEKLLLFFLASYMGSKSQCHPSFKSLAVDCSLSVDSVKRGIKSLDGKTLINVSRHMGKNNRYTFNSPIFEKLGADSTRCSQHPDADSTTHQVHTAPTPGAHSTPNNISNNIRECTSGIDPKKHGTNPPTRKNKSSSFPESMRPNESHRTMAGQWGLAVEDEFQHFKEHHLAKGNKFSRWDMAFNTWLRNARKFTSKNSRTETVNPMTGVI